VRLLERERRPRRRDIDLANEISLSKIEQNIFDDVTDAERVAGDTDYRKIFIRNENEQSWAAVKA